MIYSADKPDPRAPINQRTGQLEGEIPAVPQIPLFYVAYGYGTTMAGKYSIVQVADEDTAHEVVNKAIGHKYAFIYDAEAFRGQPEKWGLQLAPLTAAEPA